MAAVQGAGGGNAQEGMRIEEWEAEEMLKDEAYYMAKLMEMPEKFREACIKGEYVWANMIYNRAWDIAFFLELPTEVLSGMFGYYPAEEYPGDEMPPDSMFGNELVEKASWKCCVKFHKTYQEQAYRRLGVPVRHYSDADFCALHCRHSHKASWEQIRQLDWNQEEMPKEMAKTAPKAMPKA